MTMLLGSVIRGASIPEFSMAPSSAAAQPQGQQPSQNFSDVLASFAGNAVDTLRQGEASAIAGVRGTMPVQQVVEQVMAAERTLQTVIGIRDKTVTAFLEISRMQI
jgi:flagellar hook-basal body complex protein FliE